jgi:hypothetical protein
MKSEIPAHQNEGVSGWGFESPGEPSWSLTGGNKRAVVDPDRLKLIDETYPLPKQGGEDINLAGRVVATTMLALEIAGIAPAKETDQPLYQAIEAAITRTYPVAEDYKGYSASQALKAATAAFDENNTAALAIINKMYKKNLIGSVTKGRSESIIRLLLNQERPKGGV